MNPDLTWSQTACLSLSFPTCKVRWLAGSYPNTESNSNSAISPCVVYGPIQKNNSKDSASQTCEERSLPEPLVILPHDYQSHHHTAGDVPGPAPQTVWVRPVCTITWDQNCWLSGCSSFLFYPDREKRVAPYATFDMGNT